MIPLRALIVEDVADDAALVVRELTRGGFEVTWERVQTAESMAAALARPGWQVIISDYSMPDFSAPQALALAREAGRDLPFIIVSGTVGEETAMAAIHAGANDFMAKGRLGRLVPAIERELRAVKLRAEQTAMQERLIISDRMASVGTLAAGVAHEINNPLAVLIANVGFVADDLARLNADLQGAALGLEEHLKQVLEKRLGEIAESLKDVRENADRVRFIVRDLKVFSRADEEKTGPVDLRRVLESCFRMTWTEIRFRARLVKDYGDVPLIVEGNEARLSQVFLNLVVNAAQAIPEGEPEKNEIRVVTRREQDQVVVEIRDTGTGIAESVLPRIFDPFFTTKPVGTGTGLGLAISHRLISAMGGRIAVQSGKDRGTVFRVYLRAAEDGKETEAAPAPVPDGRRGRILIVDDDGMVCSAVKRMLVGKHEVSVTTSSREAFKRFTDGERFDAVLCDMMMAEMSGPELHAALLAIAPEQAEKMIFMTGGVFTPGAMSFLEKVRNPRIEKPFAAGTVLSVIHSLLR